MPYILWWQDYRVILWWVGGANLPEIGRMIGMFLVLAKFVVIVMVLHPPSADKSR